MIGARWGNPGYFNPASPGAIGGQTPAAITGTTITATTQFNVGSTDVVLNRYATKQLMISGDGTGTASGMTGWILGNDGTTLSGLWSSAVTPSASNYILRSDNGGNVAFNLASTSNQFAWFTTNSVAKMVIEGAAGAGPSITAGAATTDVQALNSVQTWNNNAVTFTGHKFDIIDQAGDAGSAAASLHTAWRAGTAGTTNIMTLGKTGIVTMGVYGAGAATFSAAGVISSVSDEAVKTNIRTFKRGLKEILALASKKAAITYNYNAVGQHDYGLDMDHDYTGFSANIVEGIIPEAVGRNSDGRRSFSDRPVTAALVNAVAELTGRINQLGAL